MVQLSEVEPAAAAVAQKPGVRRKNKQLEVMVAEVIQETPETATLVLFTGNDHLDYQPGHFLTIDPHQFPALERFIDYFEAIKGRKEPARAYSLSSAPHEQYLAVTVKEEYFVPGRTLYPPLLSPLLVWRTLKGTRMVVTGFSGPYVLPDDITDRTDHLVHICAGSGVVPNLSIIKDALERRLPLKHTLLYGSRTREDIIFRGQLEDLTLRHPGKLEVVHSLSREPGKVARYGPDYHAGRVDEALIRAHVPDPSAVEVYVCGPTLGKRERAAARATGRELRPRFMESAMAALEAIEVPRDRIHRESYG